jgi:hypothetical protein
MGLGSIISGVASVVGAVSGLSAGRSNAALSREQAERERERTRIELLRHKRNVRRVFGEQQVQFVSAGVRGDSGSALDIAADTASEADLDEKLIKAGGEARASFEESRGRQFRRTGRDVFAEGLLTAAANFANGSE